MVWCTPKILRPWFSKNNIIAGGATPFEFQGGACQGGSLAANPVVDSTAPSFVLMPRDASETSVFLDPRPLPSSAMWQNYDEVPNDGFFTPVDFRGAFGQDLWISQWSWLAEQGRLPDNLWGNFVTADGDSAEAVRVVLRPRELEAFASFMEAGAAL